MSTPTFIKINNWLAEKAIPKRVLHHEPTPTSEDSARVRGEDIAIGGKALLLKCNKDFHLFVISAAKRLDSKAIRKYLGVKKVRFATAEELMDRTGLVPGSVPPFGRPILDFQLYIDTSVAENPRIAFNAGSITDSIILDIEDYLSVAQGEVFQFSKMST
ncbi:MAG: hypothetical protein KTR30_32575 [Saprospiraceae bacterium]|nr:hypothetical protein [Saprospiraceae bacterium]